MMTEQTNSLASGLGNFEMLPLLFEYIFPVVASSITVVGLIGATLYRFAVLD